MRRSIRCLLSMVALGVLAAAAAPGAAAAGASRSTSSVLHFAAFES